MKKLFFFLLLIPFTVKAQIVADAPLPAVSSDGFYRIPLPPQVTSLLEIDLHNIRLLDENGAEVPYITDVEKPNYDIVEWGQFKMTKDVKKGCCTVVTLFNDEKKTISNFLLEIKTANIEKAGVLRGSDDGKTWYALDERIHFPIEDINKKKVLSVLDFPLSDYTYYQLTIDDSTSSPLNIVGAWLTSENVVHGMYVDVPWVKFTQKDSANGHYTWIDIHSEAANWIHRLEFDIEGPRFYKRTATLFGERSTISFDFISGQSPYALAFTKKDLKLLVKNENNPPLKFKNVRAYQLKQSVIAYLESEKNYKIAIVPDSIDAPRYDLEFFKDSIPASPTEIRIGDLKKYEREKAEAKASPTFFRDRRIIWAAIIVVIGFLAVMTVRMLREQNNSSH